MAVEAALYDVQHAECSDARPATHHEPTGIPVDDDNYVMFDKEIDCLGNDCQGSNMSSISHDAYDPERSVGYLTKRVFQLARIGLEPVFADEEITHIQWSALMALQHGVGGTAAELARHLCHDTGATTRILDTLEERDLIERSRCTTDRRVVRLSLTDAGRIVTDRCKEKVIARWDGWLADWPGEDVARFVGYLLRLRNTLETVA